MKKQDYYWIIGAVIGISIANYLTRRYTEEEKLRRIKSRMRAEEIFDKALRDQATKELQETLSKALEDSNKLREQTEKELEALSKKLKEEREKELEERNKAKDDKLRFS